MLLYRTTEQMQKKISTHYDQSIEALGVDKIRSRIEIELDDGQNFTIDADENYRGGPDNPLTNLDIENKFDVCAENLFNEDQLVAVKSFIWNLENEEHVSKIVDLVNYS